MLSDEELRAIDASWRAANYLTTDAEISLAGAGVRTFVITARGDLEIATAVRGVLDG